jgi:hypothetical protein
MKSKEALQKSEGGGDAYPEIILYPIKRIFTNPRNLFYLDRLNLVKVKL